VKVLWVTFSVIVADQLSKLYIKGVHIPLLNIKFTGMYPGESIPVIGNFFKITFIENPGMAFGFDPGSAYKFWVSLFSLAASIGLFIYLFSARKKSLSLRIAIAMILGGAIGNLIDRALYGIFFHYAPLFYGKVVDFLDFDFFDFSILGRNYDRWPIFNLADASVTVGVLILLFFYKQVKKEDESVPAIEGNNDFTPDVHSSETKENEHTQATTSEVSEQRNEEPDKGKEV
jgi:signal peptidase II